MREKSVPKRVNPLDKLLRKQNSNSFLQVTAGTWFGKLPNELLIQIWQHKTELEARKRFKKVLREMHVKRALLTNYNFIKKHILSSLLNLWEFDEFDAPQWIRNIFSSTVQIEVCSISYPSGLVVIRMSKFYGNYGPPDVMELSIEEPFRLFGTNP